MPLLFFIRRLRGLRRLIIPFGIIKMKNLRYQRHQRMKSVF